jgi:hypothetical protein
MVGFSAYLVADQFDAAQSTVESETGSVKEIYCPAEQFPEQKRREVQGLAESYARTVVEEGWPMMERGRVSARAGEIDDERLARVRSRRCTSGPDACPGPRRVQGAAPKFEVREGIPSILWVVLIVGGMITVCFTYLFGMRTPRLHVLIVVAFALVLALILYTIRALEYPFDGIVQVIPQAFELVLDKVEAGGR